MSSFNKNIYFLFQSLVFNKRIKTKKSFFIKIPLNFTKSLSQNCRILQNKILKNNYIFL